MSVGFQESRLDREFMRTFVFLLLAAAALQADSLSFINGDVSLGTSTTFTDTNNGVTATFSSAADPGGFVTASTSGFFSWGPEMLYDPGPANVADIALDIVFSTRLSDISMNFGTVNSGPLTFQPTLTVRWSVPQPLQVRQLPNILRALSASMAALSIQSF